MISSCINSLYLLRVVDHYFYAKVDFSLVSAKSFIVYLLFCCLFLLFFCTFAYFFIQKAVFFLSSLFLLRFNTFMLYFYTALFLYNFNRLIQIYCKRKKEINKTRKQLYLQTANIGYLISRKQEKRRLERCSGTAFSKKWGWGRFSNRARIHKNIDH